MSDVGLELDGMLTELLLLLVIVQHILVARCSRQLTGLADWVFVTLEPSGCA